VIMMAEKLAAAARNLPPLRPVRSGAEKPAVS